MTPIEPILSVCDLNLAFPTEGQVPNRVLHNVNLTLKKGETLGIVGESGSGKSLTSLAIMGLLPPSAIIQSGEIRFRSEGKDLLLNKIDEREFRRIRGNRISMIFQEPMTSLNPVWKCGRQVAEVLKVHGSRGDREIHRKVIELFERVELPRPEEIFHSYPHQISGGQKQRIMIAMAVACNPEIIIADEPTTALDVTVQKKILAILKDLCRENNSGLIFITHDLGVVKEIADRVVVMYRGKILEEGKVDDVLGNPKEPYTKALLACRPKLSGNPPRLPVVSDFLEGTKPKFAAHTSPPSANDPIIEVKNLGVGFPLKNSDKNTPAYLMAVDEVSFDIYRGETLGLVGESGCGKSTLGRTLVGLQRPSFGEVYYESNLLANPMNPFPGAWRRKIQMIFQDPYSSLNPGMTVEEALNEPLLVHQRKMSRREREKKVFDILDKVGLPRESASKYPHQFSGGQRQRICIARTLMVEPEFIVCDESVSALDVSVQAMVLNLLNDLKDDFGLTYVFISHDLSVVKYMSDRVVVMRKGKIVEVGDSEGIYLRPKTEYTRELIASIPDTVD